jgi:hypothetical protein
MAEKVSRTNDMKITDENVIREVKKLLADGKSTEEILNFIRFKHSEESVVNSIMEYLTKYRKKINKVASIFLNAFERKFKNTFYEMSLSKFMSKILKYKEKYHLTPEEFQEVVRLFEEKIYNSDRVNMKNSSIYPNTNLSRALGFPVMENTSSINISNDNDYSHLQDIIRLYSMYRTKHSNLVIQTMIYKDLADEAMNCHFDKTKNDINVYIHPVLAALFLPKISSIEERMLYANIAGIVNAKHNRERIITKPDYELFYSLIVDPTDIVCDAVSPIKDLKARVEVQIQLWDSVYNLRNGKYYDSQSINFLAYMDKCRISNADNPDMLYLSDEGVILRRLFAIFAFRPLVVRVDPVYQNLFNANPLNLRSQPVSTITTLPYITYKLPHVAAEDSKYALEDANNQVQFYFENESFIPKMTRILDYGRGPIIFHVPRRFINLPIALSNPSMVPFSYTSLNKTTMMHNQVNIVKVMFNYELSISSNTIYSETNKFYLRSAICYNRLPDQNIIYGHKTYLFKYITDQNNKILNSDPSNVSVYIPQQNKEIKSTDNISKENAMKTISSVQFEGALIEELYTNCTIFVYVSEYNK